MARPLRGLLMPSLVLIILSGCYSKSPTPCSTCADARLTNKWCEACKVGYVAGTAIKSKLLFDYLDAHGHELDLSDAVVTCKVCRAAIKTGGYCDECRRGWVNRLAYYSRLTYQLARGKSQDVAAITCAVCRKNSERCGWCDSCKVGMIGNVAINNRADFDDGRRGFQLMILGIETLQRCEGCAIAIVTDSLCPFCRIEYREGRAVKGA